MNNLTSTIILCTRNRLDDICRMLDSVSRQTQAATQIIVVDSSNQPLATIPEFNKIFTQEYFPLSQLIYMHTAAGLTYQRNRGIERAQGEVIYFFDDDVVLTPTYIADMQAIFENKPEMAGGMGNVFNIGHYKPWVNWMRGLFLLQRNYSHGRFTFSGTPTHAYGQKKFQHVEVLGGCCMAFRRWALEHEKFDENLRFYSYMEDVDISRRISRHHPLFYNPSAALEHLESPINRDKLLDNKAMFIANYTYLFFKNFFPHKKISIIGYLWSVVGLFLEAGLVVRNLTWVRGYAKGLRHALRHRGKRPYWIE